MAHLEPLDRIIWSADVPNEDKLLARLFGMPELRIIKLDRLFLTVNGLDAIDRLSARGLKVFADAKIVEIPSKSVGLAQLHLEHEPWMLNCMAGIESNDIMEHEKRDKIDGLKRFADACHAAGTRPCAVTVLTSKSAEAVAREFNGRTPVEQVLYYVERLLDCGFTDVVCSPKEVPAIRAESRFDDLDLNTPGIRWEDSDVRDQARVNTPDGAMRAGATREVIGSLLTESDDPALELDKIAESIASVTLAA
jgi:orotidine-5'-phosphate decarboxylase